MPKVGMEVRILSEGELEDGRVVKIEEWRYIEGIIYKMTISKGQAVSSIRLTEDDLIEMGLLVEKSIKEKQNV